MLAPTSVLESSRRLREEARFLLVHALQARDRARLTYQQAVETRLYIECVRASHRPQVPPDEQGWGQ